MLEKEPGNPKIHRLRVIHLYEWDYNLILSTKWRHLIHNVCDAGTLHPSIYGGVPGKSSLDPVFIKEMEYELCRITCHPLLQFDHDLKSCYDMIPVFLMNIESQSRQMHANVCKVQGMTLEEALYFVKTKLGISESYATHSRAHPWFGPGQGAGNASNGFTVIEDSAFKAFTHFAKGAKYTSPDGKLNMTLHILGYVDDCNNRSNNDWLDPTQTIENLVDAASVDSQWWHDIMDACNQQLELKKCNYHFIEHSHEPSGEPALVIRPEMQPHPVPLRLHDRDGNPTAINFLPSDKAIKYLGCQKAIANQKEQLVAITNRCNKNAKVINNSHLSRKETGIYYRGIYQLSVGYPLPVCYFTFPELEKAQKQAHIAMLTHSGYNRTTNKAVVYGPEHYGGIDFFHLMDLQGYGQLELFMKFWRCPSTEAGSILRITMSWVQYYTGVGWPVLRDADIWIPHMPTAWIASFREYLKDIGAHLDLVDTYIPPLQRQGDEYIMDIVLNQHIFSTKEAKRVNYCRMYLGPGVVTVADICNARGTAIDEAMYRGKRDECATGPTGTPVKQNRPDAASWQQWRRFCNLLTNTNKTRELTNKLGHWTVEPAEMRRSWPLWHDPVSDRMYSRGKDCYHSHMKLRHSYDRDILMDHPHIPATSVPADVTATDTTWRVLHSTTAWAIPAKPTLSHDIHLTTRHLDRWELELLQHLELKVPMEELMHHLLTSDIVIASDGSVKNKRASFGWVISTTDGDRLAECQGPAFGLDPTSYRAEGYGILSVLRFLHHTGQPLELDVEATNTWTICCDNQSMVKRSNWRADLQHIYPNDTKVADWDLLAEIWTSLASVEGNHKINLIWIKGHQDDDTPYEDLSLEAQLNCEADALAGEFIDANHSMAYEWVPILPTSGLQLNLPTGTVTAKHKRAVRLAKHEPPMIQHMKEQNHWDDQTFRTIDWEAHRIALRRNRKMKCTLVKHLHRITPIGKRVHKYDPKYPPECPSCCMAQGDMETEEHLYECNSPSRRKWKATCLKTLRDQMTDLDTPEPVISLFMEGLASTFNQTSPSDIPCDPSVQHIKDAQDKIGWNQLIKGRLAWQWNNTQETHLGTRATDKANGRTWAIDIATTLLKQWLDLWFSRNSDRHGVDHLAQLETTKRQTIREMSLLHEHYKPDNIQPDDHFMLDTPILTKLKWTTKQQRAWLSVFKPLLEESYQTRLATG